MSSLTPRERRRYQLQVKYKEKERLAFLGLFPGFPDRARWTVRGIYNMLRVELNKYSEEFREMTAKELEESGELRKEAILLWDPDTEAERSHQHWIEALESMVHLLRSPLSVPGVEDRQSVAASPPRPLAGSAAGSSSSSPSLSRSFRTLAITSTATAPTPVTPVTPPRRPPVPRPVTPPQPVTPPAPVPGSPPISVTGSPSSVVDNGGGAWSTLDLVICLQEITYWREMVAKIWQKAIDDPTEMSMADLSLQAAVQFFKQELQWMQEANMEWYETNDPACWNRETLEYMAEQQPNGTGGALSRIATMLREGGFDRLKETVLYPAIAPIQQGPSVWFTADAAMHQSPLLDWLAQEKNHMHPATCVAWLLWEDSVELSRQHVKDLKTATVRRLSEALVDFLPLQGIGVGNRIYARIGERVNIMTRYALAQNCVPCFAIAHTWADYLRIMGNIFAFEFCGHAIRAVTYSYELNALLGTWPPVNGAIEAEQFCNKFGGYLHPGYKRPTKLKEGRRMLSQWLRDANRIANQDTRQRGARLDLRLRDHKVVDEYKQNWARITVTEARFEVRRNEFIRNGSNEWWEAIAEKARQNFNEPRLLKTALKMQGLMVQNRPDWRTRLELLNKIEKCLDKKDEEGAKKFLAEMLYRKEFFEHVIIL
ncbi:hypothetical protein F5B22DRAFT_657826 [Xylaria bambusicola]|uniref:uncharacterized protein n=1 Tax=Xylaria bambusicola TaxID=326684 RepID=UPI002008766F|nr:uncharacterized protein F5B22DRAFT_657826 [Xylaria bambusicola]KAI0512556.1 hypothetical protein F5B22DRAFT_657826 [Xylaria bambusicola]